MKIPLFGKETKTAVDPVCGMDVDMIDQPGATLHQTITRAQEG